MAALTDMPSLTASPVVRPAAAADLPAILAMGLRFLAEEYPTLITAKAEAMEALVARFVDTPGIGGFVAEAGGVLVGMIGLILVTHPMSGQTIASEMAWWVEPEHRGGRTALRLLQVGEAWARQQGATALHMVAPTARVERFYERLGFWRVETIYQRALA